MATQPSGMPITKLAPGPIRQSLRFDRHQHDPHYRRLNQFSPESAYSQELKIVESTRVGSEPEIDFNFMATLIRVNGGLPESKRLLGLKEQGVPWAVAATTENVLALPLKQALCFLWFYWGGLSIDEIAPELGLSNPRSVYVYLDRARRTLESLVV